MPLAKTQHPADRTRARWLRLLRVLSWLILTPFVLLLITFLLVQLPPVQDYLRGRTVEFLEEKIGTPVQLDHIELRYPLGVRIEGFLVRDQLGDTLLYVGTLNSSADPSSLISGKVALSGTALSNVRATITQRADSTFNFDFIIDAFASADPTNDVPTDTIGGPVFSMDGLTLEDIRLSIALAPEKLSMGLQLGKLVIDMEEMDPARMRFHVGELLLADTRMMMRTAPGPSEPDTYPELANPFDGLDITLGRLTLDNVGFTMVNELNGDSLWMAVGKGDLLVDEMALDQQRFRIKSMALDRTRFGMLQPNAVALVDTMAPSAPLWLGRNDGFRFWMRGLDIEAKALTLLNGDLQLHNGSVAPATKAMDPDHLVLGAIELDLKDLVLNDHRIGLHLENLSAKPGTSAPVLRVGLDLDATQEHIALSDGTISAGNVKVNFSGSAAPGDLSAAYRSPEQVPLKARIDGALALGRIGPLLEHFDVQLPKPLLATETWGTHLVFAGTSNSADTLSLDLFGDQNSVIHLTGRSADLKGLPGTAFHVDLKELVMGQGMRDLIRPYVPANVSLPDRLTGSARIDGSGTAVDARLDLKSDLGDVTGTFTASGLSQRTPAALNADLVITNADLRRIVGDTALNKLSVHVVAQGSGLNADQRTGRLEVSPTKFSYLGQDLSGPLLVAELQGDSVFATVRTDAPALAVVADLRGRWPGGTDSVSGALNLRVERLALHEMGWYSHPLNVYGAWRGSGAFSTDGFGSFNLTGDSVQLFNSERSFHFERFAMAGLLAKDSTAFELDSDALELTYRTNAVVDSVLARAKEKVLSFFHTDTTLALESKARMDLRVALPRTEWLTGIVLPDLNAIDLKDFRAHFDKESFEINIDLPYIEHRAFQIEELTVAASAKDRALDGALRIGHIALDSLHIHGLELTAASAPGSLLTTLRIQDEKEEPSYVVPIRFDRDLDVIVLHLEEGLVLDRTAWIANAANELRFTERGVEADNFILSSGDQRLQVITELSRTLLQLDQFNIGTFTNFIASHDTLPIASGGVSGQVVIPLNDAGDLEADLRVEELTLSGQVLGDLVIKARGTGKDVYTGTFTFENGPNTLDGNIRYDGAQVPAAMVAHADIGLVDLSFLKPFTSKILYDLRGGLNGTVDWASRGDSRTLNGDITFKDTELGVLRTGARYRLKNERVLADRTGIRFRNFTVLDSLGNAFTLDGQVFSTDLVKMRFDLTLRTESFHLVHSDPASNAFFYGDLFTSANLRITGTGMAPIVKGALGILNGTDLSVVIPGSEVDLVSSDGIVEFTTDLYGTDTTHMATDEERLRDSLKAQLPRIDLDLHVRIDPRAGFAVVLDPTTGDQATFKGDGDLRFQYTPEGEMRLTGPFVLAEGGYTLEFYGLVKKRFDLVPGGQVVWDGDPVAARMGIQAKYVSESASYPLIANSIGGLGEAERNRLASRLPFEVLVNIDGAISKPDITFGLDLPREFRNSYPKVDQELDRLSSNGREDERNRQVFGLLVLNSFIEDAGTGNAPSSGIASSAARNSVNGMLTDQLNKVTGRYLKGVDIQLGVNTVDQAQGSAVYQRTSVDYKVSKSILDERLSFEVGGSVGVNEQNKDVSNVSSTRAAQYAILYDLTRDGRFRLRGFYENAFDLYDGEITDSGVALMFTRDFEENEKARERARSSAREKEEEERKREKEKDRPEGTKEEDAPNSEPKRP